MHSNDKKLLTYIDQADLSGMDKFFKGVQSYLEEEFPGSKVFIYGHRHAPHCYYSLGESLSSFDHLKEIESVNKSETKNINSFLQINNDLLFPLRHVANEVGHFLQLTKGGTLEFEKLERCCTEIRQVYRLVISLLDDQSKNLRTQTANLVSQISHDINSLSTLINSEQAISESVKVKAAYSEKSLQGILFYLREFEIEKTRVPITGFIDGILDELPFPDGMKFEKKITGPFDFIEVDVELIEQVLLNVFDNAFFASQFGNNAIALNLCRRKSNSLFDNCDWLEILVQDKGPGISSEFVGEVTKPFFTTWKDQGHVGLGLSVADKICQSHGGSINIESRVGEGTTVKIYLPFNGE